VRVPIDTGHDLTGALMVGDGESPRSFLPGGAAPVLAPGLDKLGEFDGSGLREPVHLVRRADGQVIQLTALLSLVLDTVDGHRSVADIAGRVSAASGRPVSPANVCYLLERRLVPLGLVASPDGTLAAPRASHLTTVVARRTLIPAAAVGAIARTFAPLFHPIVVTGMLLALVGADIGVVGSADVLASIRATISTPAHLLAVLGLVLTSMMFHEFGHAAACRYSGGRPGRIGCGIVLVWPALYTDVTDAYRLDRPGRLRTDLGGVYFNAVFAVAMAATWTVTGVAAFGAAVVLVHFEALRQLLPIVRFDGYHILSDLAGVPDLFSRMRPVLADAARRVRGRLRRGTHRTSGSPPVEPALAGLSRKARITINVWVLATALFLIANLTIILLVGPRLLATTARSTAVGLGSAAAAVGAGAPFTGLLDVTRAALLALPAVAIVILLTRLGLHLGRAVRRCPPGGRRRAAVLTLASAAVVVAFTTVGTWRG
jgi:putative peptide zinc metalloprotease protein